jgi:transketolase
MKIDMRDAFFERLVEAARQDGRIIVLSADHGAFALKKFEEEMPDRYINMGIAEQNMVGVAAGLAASGKIVFIYGISPFVSLRVLEQLTIDVATMQLPVNVVSVGAGFTYSTDGPTHQGLQDVAAVTTIPGIKILNSSDPANTQAFVDLAVKSEKPHYIRIEKEKLPILPRNEDIETAMNLGFSSFGKRGSSLLIITTGIIGQVLIPSLKKWEIELEITISLIDVHQIKPFPEMSEFLQPHTHIAIFEDAYSSTIASEVLRQVASSQKSHKTLVADVGESFQFKGGSRDFMSDYSGISPDQLRKRISNFLNLR